MLHAIGILDLRIEVSNPLKRPLLHPLAVAAYVLGEATRPDQSSSVSDDSYITSRVVRTAKAKSSSSSSSSGGGSHGATGGKY